MMKNTIKIKTIVLILSLVVISIIYTGCTTPKDDEKVNNIIEQTKYLKIERDKTWDKIYIDAEDDRAYAINTSGEDLFIIRDKNVLQEVYDDDGGEYILKYKSDWKLDSELYYKAYFKGIKDLDLTVKDVKDSDYVIEIEEGEKMDRFYAKSEGSGFYPAQNPIGTPFIRITFDKKCRPILLERCVWVDEKHEKVVVGYQVTQKYSYNISKGEFNRGYKKIEKSMEGIRVVEYKGK